MAYNFNKSAKSLKREHDSEAFSSPEKKLKLTRSESPPIFPVEVKEEILSSGEKMKKKWELNFEPVVTVSHKKSKKKNHASDGNISDTHVRSLFQELPFQEVENHSSDDLTKTGKKRKKKEHNTFEEKYLSDEPFKVKKKREKLLEVSEQHTKKHKKKKEAHGEEMEEEFPTDRMNKESFTDSDIKSYGKESKKKKKQKRNHNDIGISSDYSINEDNANEVEQAKPKKHTKQNNLNNESGSKEQNIWKKPANGITETRTDVRSLFEELPFQEAKKIEIKKMKHNTEEKHFADDETFKVKKNNENLLVVEERKKKHKKKKEVYGEEAEDMENFPTEKIKREFFTDSDSTSYGKEPRKKKKEKTNRDDSESDRLLVEEEHKKKHKKKKEVYGEETEKFATKKMKGTFTDSDSTSYGKEPKKKKKDKWNRDDSEMSTDYSINDENLNETEIFTTEPTKHKKHKKKNHSIDENASKETEVQKKKKHKHKYQELPIQTLSRSFQNNSKDDDKNSRKESENLQTIPETSALPKEVENCQKSPKRHKHSELEVSNSGDENSKTKKKPQVLAENMKTENLSIDDLLLHHSVDIKSMDMEYETPEIQHESRKFEESDQINTSVARRSENPQESLENVKNESSDSALDVSEGPENDKCKHKKKFNTDVSEEKFNTRELCLQKNESVDIDFNDILEDEKNLLTAEERKRLTDLSVLLPWPVHPLHMVETRIAGRPSKDQWNIIYARSFKLKQGIYSKSEDDIIRRNWENFCKLHDMPLDPKYFLRLATPEKEILIPVKERIRFVQFLAHGLPNRLLCSVYKRFQRLFFPKEIITGRFDPREDKVILDYLKTCKSETPFSDLAKILNRDRLAIEKRSRKLKYINEGITEVKWTADKIAEFMQHFVDVTKVDSVDELEDRHITVEEWKEMSARMNLPSIKLRPAWFVRIYPRIFIHRSVKMNVVKILLIDVLIEKGKTDWRDVNWEEIAEEFDGFNGQALNKIMKELVRNYVPLSQRSDLGECLKCLEKEKTRIRGLKMRKIDIIDG
ncbi:hypothetical protein TcasGA2_TC003555 [Tribolium castaneum]|uniref:Myb-like domain-containing protein n=1 Tax=Tribolium castaneum TaxID=7070 RepID=D6WHR0_TRICA|nr:PREDICTED: myosin-10 [Tribolium castaneum]EFA00678.2 hypothetical protein TcasGA2_TC003555 [Tribolium castaneum]|eukprot:XP_008191078.2 PREDICTED: myosin-10 [Tribolium castaneum]